MVHKYPSSVSIIIIIRPSWRGSKFFFSLGGGQWDPANLKLRRENRELLEVAGWPEARLLRRTSRTYGPH